jgi:hypothetical protein
MEFDIEAVRESGRLSTRRQRIFRRSGCVIEEHRGHVFDIHTRAFV